MDLTGTSAVIVHPHPSMGGDSSHPFVVEVANRLSARGVQVATPDFDDPNVATAAPALGDAQFLVGYSWGSVVVSHAHPPGVVARVLVAPPASMELGDVTATPTLVLIPEHDQYGDLEATEAALGDADIEIIPGADHFLWGHIDEIATRVVDWLAQR